MIIDNPCTGFFLGQESVKIAVRSIQWLNSSHRRLFLFQLSVILMLF